MIDFEDRVEKREMLKWQLATLVMATFAMMDAGEIPGIGTRAGK